MLLLQRRRSDGDCGRWRTVLRIRSAHLRLAEAWVQAGMMLDQRVEWRLTTPDGQVFA